ncbi:hypothetical protein [Vreelandella populi]|uniref:hypothetical protein n=1 Tax=Vreelandella populi TaxID=2498858 RepID=UPI000F8E574C|nr:hypothetical protein [Halomonas populi]RUR38557.1 hypothetical protein ELY25_09345 [Halomonas populi]
MSTSLPPQSWSLKEAVQRFHASGFTDGDLVTHEWLAWSLALPEPTTATEFREQQFVALDRVEQFKTALLTQHQIALQSVRGKGYRVVPPAEQARYAAEEASRHIEKGLRRGDQLLSNTRLDALTDDERRRHIDTESRMASLASMASRGRRDIFKLFQP